MTKRRTILAILLGILMALCLSFAVACGGGEESGGNSAENGTIRWTINDPANVTVTVDGKTDLPSSYAVGETLTFKAVPKDGYEAEVKNGRTTLRANNNSEYSFQVKKGNNDVSVAVSKKISGIEVTASKDLVYYAGETVNNADLTVKLLYATNESETKTDGFVINYPTTAGRFALGDTSFTVTYGTVTSAPVQLKSAVVGKVTIDPQGGKIADSYKTALADNNEIANIAVDAKTNALTFTFAEPLVNPIRLPSESAMTRGETSEEQSDFQFVAWINGKVTASSVPAELDVSATYTARWDAHLLELTKIYYDLEEKDGEKIPNLIVEGTYRAAKTAYLYLYEGNAQVELVGPTIGGEDVKRGDSFKLTFDMRKVIEAGYVGKWMDIKFVAETDGVKDTQEINLADYAGVDGFYTPGDQINADGYRYYFETYEFGGSTTLKAVAAEYVSMEYTIAVQGNETEKLEFKFSGTVKENIFYGKTAVIDFYVGSTKSYYGTIGNDGKFEITVDTSDWPLANTAYAHFSVIESQENTTKLFPKSGEYNLVNNDCKNTDFADNGEKAPDGGNGNLLTSGTLMMHNADWTRTFYIGPGKWGGIIAYGYNENASLEVVGDIALKVDDMTNPTKVYYVVTVKVGGKVGYTEEQLKTIVFGNTDGGVVVYRQDNAKFAVVEGQEKTYKLWFDVTEHKNKSMLWSNLYFEKAPAEEDGTPTYNKILEIKDSNCSTNGLYAVVGGIRYTILCTTAADPNASGEFNNNTYNSSNLICTAAAETDTNPEEVDPNYVPKTYTLTVDYLESATSFLTIVDGSPVLTIKGTIEGFDPDHVKFDVQVDDAWNYIVPAVQSFVVDGSGRFTLTVNLSDIPVNGAKYFMHIQANVDEITETTVTYLDKNGKAIDLELTSEMLAAIQKADGDVLATQKVGSKVYSVEVYGKWSRHMVALTVADDTTPVYTATKAELVQEESKVYFVVTGTSKNYTDEALSAENIRVTLQHNDNWNNQGWEYVTPADQTLTVTNGAWTLKADVTSVALGSYTCKLTKAGPEEAVGDGNSSDLKQVEAVESAYELGGKKYVTVHAVGSSVPKQYWGCVGFEIFESNASNVDTIRVDLEVDNDKVYFVLTLRAPSFTADTIVNLKMGNGADNAIECSKMVASHNGVYFTLYYDITDLETPEWYWTHLYQDGQTYDGSDGNIYADFVTSQVSYNGKKYEVLHGDGQNGTPNTWWVVVINITEEN